MPVPKRKNSKQRRNKRFANKGLKPGAVMACLTCREPILPHLVCSDCGYYKGKKIIQTKSDRAQKRGDVLKSKQDKGQPYKVASSEK